MRLKILIITLFIAAPLLANAKIYIYVTDQVEIPMRSTNKVERNPSNVQKMLPSGTKLEILSTENGWTKVKYKNQTGWIISRYLTARPTASVQLEELKKIYNDSNSLSEMKLGIKISNKVIEKNIKKTLDFLEEQKSERVVSSLSCNINLKNNPNYSGIYICEYISGTKATKGCYVDGKKEGWWNEWHPNGNKRYGAGYVSGDPITELFSYDIKGDLAIRAYPVISDETRQLVFSKNRIKKETCYCGSAKQIQRLEGACIDFIK